jgi:hypothetical protein
MTGTDEGREFDAVIGADGVIRVPADILRTIDGDGRMRVRLTPVVIAEELERRNVTHEEVERIASLQLESRSQVIAFLMAEGALARGRVKPARRKARKR